MIPTLRKAKVQSSVKKSLRKSKLKRSADGMVWLSYILFMKSLATECHAEAVAGKSKVITADHVVAVRKKVLKKVRG